MAPRTVTLPQTCHSCGKSGTMTCTEEDQMGPTTRWIEATGTYEIGADGKPHCKCGAPD
jgi:hypothetical protein